MEEEIKEKETIKQVEEPQVNQEQMEEPKQGTSQNVEANNTEKTEGVNQAPAVENAPVEEHVNPTEEKTEKESENQIGPFGTIYTQFKDKAKEAIAWLLDKKEGEAIGALHHKNVGDIDLVWGKEGTGKSDGFGLAKLAKFHPEVLDNLQEILDSMRVTKRSANRIKLESDSHQASVRLKWDNTKKNWLLTAFEKKNSVSGNTTNTAETTEGGMRNDTATSQNTVSVGKVTNTSENKQGNPTNEAVERRKADSNKQDGAVRKSVEKNDKTSNPLGRTRNRNLSKWFGPIYTQFEGKANEAESHLRATAEGVAKGALVYPSVSPIDLVWGDMKAGYMKIVIKHPEVVGRLQEILSATTITSQSDNRIVFESDTHKMIVSRMKGSQPTDNWLLTAYEKKEKPVSASSSDIETEPEGKRNGTATPQNGASSADKVTNTPDNNQGETEKIGDNCKLKKST